LLLIITTIEENKIFTNKNYPQIALIIPSKVDKTRLTDKQIKQFDILTSQMRHGSITMEEVIFQLRGGDGLSDVVAIIAFVSFMNWYDSLFGVEAFQAYPLPHMDPIGWANGKYDYRNAEQRSSHSSAQFERKALHQTKQMCAASADENGFMMSYHEDSELVKETYQGFLKINTEQNIDYW